LHSNNFKNGYERGLITVEAKEHVEKNFHCSTSESELDYHQNSDSVQIQVEFLFFFKAHVEHLETSIEFE
jgi:transcription initiation factor IIE alpha subunit